MDLRRPLVALAIAGTLAAPISACGANSDLNRNEQECGAAEAAAGQDREELCQETEQDNEQEPGGDENSG